MRSRLLSSLLVAVVLSAVGLFAGCGEDQTASTVVVTVTESAPAATKASPAPAPARSTPVSEPVAASGSFTGSFGTPDGIQLCRATNSDVTCVSQASGQQVRLDRSGAVYEGTDQPVLTLDAPPLRGTATTPSGISCEATSRGMECSRGGHGFIIGDTRLIVLRGSTETVHDSADDPPPQSSGSSSLEDYILSIGIDCDTFLTQPAAQNSLESWPKLAQSLDPDGNGLACEGLPQTFDLDDLGGDYGSVDLGNEAPALPASDGYWAKTCPGGSCYGAISDVTGRPRTTFVSGYTRSDGTYVGSYYRSSR